MRVLITGSSGFIGSRLARLFCDNHDVLSVDILRYPFEHPRLHHLREDFVKLRVKDIRGVDIIYHLAAKLPVDKCSFEEYYRVNVRGTRVLLERSLEAGVKRFVYVSSSAVYGYPRSPITEGSLRRPREPYGLSKYYAELVCEQYRRDHGMDISIVRPRTVIGSKRLGILYLLFYWIRNNKHVYLIGDGRNRYQLLSIWDLIRALFTLRHKGDYEDFNLGTDKFLTLREDIDDLIRVAGSRSRIVLLPSFSKVMCRIADRFIPLARWHYDLIDRDFYFDISKARDMLGWIPIHSNLEMLVEAYRTLDVSEDHRSSHFSPVDLRLLRLLP